MSYYQFKLHPITDREWWGRIAGDPRTRGLVDALRTMRREATEITRHPHASEILSVRRINSRKIGDQYMQSRVILGAATVERCIDGGIADGNDDFLLDQLWSYLTCPTWVIGAHLRKDLPLTSASQLDLGGCEMAACLAETLEVLKPWVDAQSATLADSIVYEIDRRILTPFVQQQPTFWCDLSRPRWHNWAGVCAGSILAACESLANLGHPRPEAREKAIDVLGTFLQRGFTPAGECDEGIGYWSYGLGFAMLGWSRLSREEFSQRFDQDRFRTVANYPQTIHLFDDTFFSGNDAPMQASPSVCFGGWLGWAAQSEWLSQWGANGVGPVNVPRAPMVIMRLLDFLLHIDREPRPLPEPVSARYLADQQVGIFRSGRMHVTLTGGNNKEAHNHNDLGHINVWVDKALIIPDLGGPFYTGDFFGPNRYKYLSASSRGHCCPIINGVEQIEGLEAEGKQLELDLQRQHLVLDLTSAYPPEARLTRWTRGLSRIDDGYELVDEFLTEEPVRMENVFWSTVEPKLETGKVVLGPLRMEIDRSIEVKVESVDPKEHLLKLQGPLYRIGLSYQSDGATALIVRTKLVAGNGRLS